MRRQWKPQSPCSRRGRPRIASTYLPCVPVVCTKGKPADTQVSWDSKTSTRQKGTVTFPPPTCIYAARRLRRSELPLAKECGRTCHRDRSCCQAAPCEPGGTSQQHKPEARNDATQGWKNVQMLLGRCKLSPSKQVGARNAIPGTLHGQMNVRFSRARRDSGLRCLRRPSARRHRPMRQCETGRLGMPTSRPRKTFSPGPPWRSTAGRCVVRGQP